MNLTYGYNAAAGQMGAGSTAGNASQLMSVSGTIGAVTESAAYTYDNLGRLVTSNQTSNGSSAQRRFAYDRWANRTGVWDAVTGGNQIQSVTLQQSGGAPTNQIASVTSGSTLNYTYDGAGNVTNDGVLSYTYDSENRLVGVDGGATASYAYDHQNRRYKKTIGATVTHYVWEGSQVLAEHNGSTGAVLIDYAYSSGRMIAKIASGSTQYFLSDRLSTRLVVDSGGNVIGRQGHLPFGENFAESGTQEKHLFNSYERDAESGTDYGLNRQYTQRLGRFLKIDPATCNNSNPQSSTRYSYALNDPINLFDPDGRAPKGVGRARGLALRFVDEDDDADQDHSETDTFRPTSRGKKKKKPPIKIPVPNVRLVVTLVGNFTAHTVTVRAFGKRLSPVPFPYDSLPRDIAPGLGAILVNMNVPGFGHIWEHCMSCLTCIIPVVCVTHFHEGDVRVAWIVEPVPVPG